MTQQRLSNHFIISLYPFNGHARPLTSIACSLLALHPNLHITLLINPSYTSLVKSFISQQRPQNDDGRLKIISCLVDRVGFSLEGIWDELDKEIKGSAVNVYTDLLKGETETWDRGKGEVVGGLCGIKPSLIVCDFFLFLTSKIVDSAKANANSTSDLPLYVFLPAPVASYIQHVAGPPHGGPIGIMRPSALQTLRASGDFDASTSDDDLALTDEFESIAMDMYKSGSTEEIVACPGVPDMLAYEYFPQQTAMPIPPTAGRYLSFSAHQALTSASGIISPWSSSVLEPDAVEGAKKIYPDLEVLAVGAQGTDALWDKVKGDRGTMSAKDREVLEFLDGVEERYPSGKRALFISFGSLWFPLLRPDLIVHLIETLLDLPEDEAIPFVFALASPVATIDDALRERVKASGRGMLPSFAPQYEILIHPATGWFLTHGGSNSTSEALICGVPMIFWPSLADQPGIATQLTLTLDAAFELIQVRTPPPDLLPLPTARGVIITGSPEAIRAEMKAVFTRAMGAEGERKRARVVELSEAMRREKKEGGQAREAMETLGRIGLLGTKGRL